jgi:hypothetical protein
MDIPMIVRGFAERPGSAKVVERELELDLIFFGETIHAVPGDLRFQPTRLGHSTTTNRDLAPTPRPVERDRGEIVVGGGQP